MSSPIFDFLRNFIKKFTCFSCVFQISIGENGILLYYKDELLFCKPFGAFGLESPLWSLNDFLKGDSAMAKVTCPVCFTRMNEVGHDLVCPVCGYKYCEKKDPYSYDDHNHNEYRSYNRKTSYTGGNYGTGQGAYSQTAQGNYSQTGVKAQGTYSQAGASTQSTYSQAAQGSYSRTGQGASQAGSGVQRQATRGSYSQTGQGATQAGSGVQRQAAASGSVTGNSTVQSRSTSQNGGTSPQSAVRKVIITIVVIYFIIWIVFAILSNIVMNLGQYIQFEDLENILEQFSEEFPVTPAFLFPFLT